MMIKVIMLIILTYIVYATSSMNDIVRKGYFDTDNIEDKIVCKIDNCTIQSSLSKNIIVDISNNMNCRDLNIYKSKIKGEILIECGGYLDITQTYYKYNQKLKNWFANKIIYEKSPSGPNENDDEYYQKIVQKSWSIDKKIYKIKGKDTLFSLFQDIIKLYKNKEFLTLKALIKSVNLKHLKIEKSNLPTYNNIAYYLQKAGSNKEAVYLLEKIIAKYPNRTVAYYNLGDAYWALGDKKKARKAYTTYTEQMCDAGKQKRIPKVVIDRVSSK